MAFSSVPSYRTGSMNRLLSELCEETQLGESGHGDSLPSVIPRLRGRHHEAHRPLFLNTSLSNGSRHRDLLPFLLLGYGSCHRHFVARPVVTRDIAKKPSECLVAGLFKVSFHDGFGEDVWCIIRIERFINTASGLMALTPVAPNLRSASRYLSTHAVCIDLPHRNTMTEATQNPESARESGFCTRVSAVLIIPPGWRGKSAATSARSGPATPRSGRCAYPRL